MPTALRVYDYRRRGAGTSANVRALDARDDGFTLIEVMIATAIFVFVALAGFETLRQIGAVTTMLGQRAGSAAALATAVGQLRADAESATAVWIPASTCGSAVSMMRRNAGGTSFTSYVAHEGALMRATGPGPINPCDAALTLDTVLTNVASVTAVALSPSALPNHLDVVSGNADGGFFRSGIPSITVSSHALDFDGSTIMTGNAIVELTIDADPAETSVDLVAGNRPNAYTNVLAYACGARCAATGIFPEIASLDVSACEADAPDLPDSPTWYVAGATGVSGAGRIVTTAYSVRLRYGFTFSGVSSPVTAYRTGPVYLWPAAANLSDSYPVDYGNNALRSTGAATLATQFGSPANLPTEISLCSGMNTELLFHG